MSNRQRTAKSHPHDLHETHDAVCGWQTFGKVGRFKHGKTWFMATLVDGHPAWWPNKFSCRTQAEQACFNRWLELHNLDVTARANARMLAQVQKANEAALEAENASAAEALRNASAEELADALADALADVLSGCNGRVYGDAFNHAKEKLATHLEDLYVEDARDEIIEEITPGIEEQVREEEFYMARDGFGPVLRLLGRAAYGEDLTSSDRADLRDFLSREWNAYNAGAAKFL